MHSAIQCCSEQLALCSKCQYPCPLLPPSDSLCSPPSSLSLLCPLSFAELSNLWRVRKTIHAMLNERGYLLTQEDMNMTMEEFKTHFGDNPPSE